MIVIVDIKRFEKGYHEKCNKNVTFDKISRTFPQIETTLFLMLTLFRHHYFFAQIKCVYIPSVVDMFEWPMRLETISGFTPNEMHIEAYV